jgi:predicted alpha/beta hydrolase family esterase
MDCCTLSPMRKLLLLQGGGAGAHEADQELAASLRHELGRSYEVQFPTMPDEASPDYARWKPHVAEELAALPEGAFLAGHSLGAAFLLKYLSEEKVEHRPGGVFLLAAPYWGGDGWRYEGYERLTLAETAAAKLASWPLFLYHGRDDKIVPFSHLALYAKLLPHAVVRPLDGRGHQFNNDLSVCAADMKRLADQPVTTAS